MSNFIARLNLLLKNLDVFRQYTRGIEREALRCYKNGRLATTPHPKGLGSAYSNRWITTDFSESLLEFITPVSNDISVLLSQLEDMHHFTQTKLGKERLWPLSMPCHISNENDINLAQYGSSNSAKMKMLYRKGLKYRYGSLMQIISGVHFNFSFPDSFWDALFGEQDNISRRLSKSKTYFGLIRNYYRFGWLIPYFFGASPALCSSFVKDKNVTLPFKNIGKTLYLPKATSLRLSDLGYINSFQNSFKISLNTLEQYLNDLNQAIRMPSENFRKIGVKINGEHRQLNSNLLQIENELYTPIRPKCIAKNGEKPAEALKNFGVEYIEVRSLDINPYSPIGITKEQICFLDIFLTWASLIDSDHMDYSEFIYCCDNWRKVVLQGRKIGLELRIDYHYEKIITLQECAKDIFKDLLLIAKSMDIVHSSTEYQDICTKLSSWINDPELTVSGQLLEMTKRYGSFKEVGYRLGEQYRSTYLNHRYKVYSSQELENEVVRSRYAQANQEKTDIQSFDEYLEEYFSYLKR
ncbi:glutamate-cysteine ligase [Candidatus Photodesmus katoptron]|uniref:Glutamate--cysteine ligase n=1 Tax=Candidatus Photodesmus katoptron Akat1 TaxID=1236703 RepID=S3EI42_9GAMM|nr:glutamate--cysteine ligase [Candidatus Photodesmus katoptron]EPE37843.1 glutamate--cysteine ligase [Candidatus Photodesmus katoptron Akat1]KEY90438.1 glutamate-cysteine ligase [Candidatus Photodesmus katoptron]